MSTEKMRSATSQNPVQKLPGRLNPHTASPEPSGSRPVAPPSHELVFTIVKQERPLDAGDNRYLAERFGDEIEKTPAKRQRLFIVRFLPRYEKHRYRLGFLKFFQGIEQGIAVDLG